MPKFECKKCGRCCGPIPFTIPMFKRFKHLAIREYTLIPWPGENCVVPIAGDGNCIFLNDNNLCAIYLNRPKVCRLQGRISKLPCPHNEDYENSPYPHIYQQMVEDILGRGGLKDSPVRDGTPSINNNSKGD